MVAVDDDDGVVDGADGGCVGVVSSDVAASCGNDGLVGVSLACTPVSQVLEVSVDVPASFSRRGGSSLGAVCITASTVVAGVVWVLVSVVTLISGSVCILPLTRFVCPSSRSAVLPFSSPSLSPFSYPSRLPSSSVVLRTFSSSSLARYLPSS